MIPIARPVAGIYAQSQEVEETMATAVARPVRPHSIAALVALARRYSNSPADWCVNPRFEPDRRWYARLATAQDHEAWLLTWLPGQATDLHDHGGSAGAFVVVSGQLTEQTLAPAGDLEGAPRLVETRLPATAARGFGPHHIHRMVNEGPEPAVSVHLYGPALIRMTRYTIVAGRLTVESVSKAGEDW